MKKLKMKSKSDTFDPEVEFLVDEDRLADEYMYQPILMAKVAKIFSEKYKISKDLEADLNVYKSELADAMRDDPKTWGISDKKGEKDLSDTMISRLAFKDPDYVKLYKKANAAKAEAKEWEFVVEGCKQRDNNLGRLAKMNS